MRITTNKLRKMKGNTKISMLTAYDYSFAKIIDKAGCEIILVGDSLGNVVLGYDASTKVTMEDIIHHTKAVARGTQNAMVISDMPFLSCHLGVEKAVENAGRLIQAGAHAVKIEGGAEVAEAIKRIVAAGIPVMAHIGLMPQSINQLGGFFTHGKTSEQANKLIEDALLLQASGCFSLLLECVQPETAKNITSRLTIPTIGIGSGSDCDGQVLVIYDMLGLFTDYVPSFVTQYANMGEIAQKGVEQYIQDVRNGK